MAECHTAKFLQASITQYFLEVMVVLWVAEWMSMENATLNLLNQGLGTLQMCHVLGTLWCKQSLFVKMMPCCWFALVWLGKKCCASVHIHMILLGIPTSVLRLGLKRSTTESSNSLAWWTAVGIRLQSNAASRADVSQAAKTQRTTSDKGTGERGLGQVSG